MRVLQVNTERSWRGGERQTLYTLTALCALGIDAQLLCTKGAPLEAKAREAGIPVHAASGQAQAAYIMLTTGRSFDLLHAQTGKAHSLAIALKPLHRRPVLYTRRVDFVPKGMLTGMKYKHTDCVVAISHAIKDILHGMGIVDVPVIPSAVQHNILDKQRAMALLAELGISNKKIIATVAALTPHKDPATMVRAVAALASTRRDFAFLHFGGGKMMDDIRALVQSEGLEGTYFLLGHTEAVEDFYSIMDVYAMSSVEEGLGSSVLDAFLYNAPVVSTDAGGLKETVATRGILCPSRDPQCLARGINEMLVNDTLRSGYISAAHAHVTINHSVEAMARAYAALYAKLI